MFNFTQQERQVVIFLISAALIGIGIHYLKTERPCRKITEFIFAQDIGKVNLNTADKEALMSVSGIGKKLAERIIEHRQANGEFTELDEIRNIEGINNYRFEKIKDHLIVKQ